MLGALSVAAQQQHTRMRELQAELERTEGQLRIEHRWQPGEANCTEVQSERKHFNFWQRQQAIRRGTHGTLLPMPLWRELLVAATRC